MNEANIRLDKWLWAARFYKTRALAKQAIEGGKIRINNNKTKAGKSLAIGDCIELFQGHVKKTVVIERLTDKRRGAKEAELLYHETDESKQKRELHAEQRKILNAGMHSPKRKPDKKQRRALVRLKTDSLIKDNPDLSDS